MSKIQLSYKIIKRDSVSLLKDNASVIDTKLDLDIVDFNYGVRESQPIYEEIENTDHIRDRILEELREEVREERQSIIQEAKAEAEDIRRNAKEEGFKEGFNKGLDEGYKQGMEKGSSEGFESGYLKGIEDSKEEAQSIKRSAIKILEEAQGEVCKYMNVNQQKIIKLAAQMAESIVHSTIDSSSENILQLIKPIIQQFRKVESVIITCNPDNYDYLKKSIYEMEKKYEDIKFIILEDDSLEKNGCRIENENQIIDLQIKKQLNNIIEKINNLE